MRVHKHLPAGFEARIEAFAFEMVTIFTAILIVIFMVWHPVIEALFVIGAFYSVTLLPMVFHPGRSLGKLSAKTVIVDLDDQPVTLYKAHMRECFKWVAGFLTLGLYFVVAFAVFTQNREHRTLHDFIFKTKVVYVEERVSGD